MSIPPEPDLQQFMDLKRSLQLTRSHTGKFDISKIRQTYSDWSEQHENEISKMDDPGLFSGFYSRMAIGCLKLAMLYHLSEDCHDTMTIELEALDKAISLMEYLRCSLRELLSESFETDKGMKYKIKVLRLIRETPGILHSTLLQHSHIMARDFKEVIETLTQENSIRCIRNGRVIQYICNDPN